MLAFLLLAQAHFFAESSGCAGPTLRPGRRQQQVVSVQGARSTEARKFIVTVPASAGPLPVLFAYHGYTNDAAEIADEHRFDELAEQHGFIVVYAEGMRDGANGGSWNLGPQDKATCDKPTYTSCYDSCKAGGCGACAWHTCVDDLAFADALVAQVSTAACVDMTRLYLYGESAGAMFTYRLLGERPGVYAAAAPEQGLPYASTGPAPHGSWPAILHLHDRQDTTVPIRGGRSEDGWLYNSLGATLQSVCGGTTKTPFETSLPAVECTQYLGCRGGPVVQCLYDGEHGHLPDGVRLKDGAEKAGLSDDFIWNFLKDFQSTGLPELDRTRARWERLALAALLAAVFISGAALLVQHHRASGEAKALLGH